MLVQFLKNLLSLFRRKLGLNELVIFDWDDTLLKTIEFLRAPLHHTLYLYVKEYLEPALSREDFDIQSDKFYKELRSTIQGWRIKHDLPADFIDTIHKLANKPMRDAVIAATIRNEERLARLRRLKELGYTLIIVTHNDIEFCWPLMEEYGYTEFFEKEDVYDLRTVRHLKTTPESYTFVLKDLKRRLRRRFWNWFRRIHMIDDTDVNLKCAKELGMETYHVLGERPVSEEAKAYTDYAYPSVDHVMDRLIRLAA